MVYRASGPLVLVGAGNMGGALLSGWLKKGVPGSQVIVIDPRPSDAMRTTIAEAGATHSESVPDGVKAGILFVAVKPQMMEAVLPSLKPLLGPETVVVSIAVRHHHRHFRFAFRLGRRRAGHAEHARHGWSWRDGSLCQRIGDAGA